MLETTNGPLTAWKDDAGKTCIVAADADCIRWFLDRRDDAGGWRIFGSPDQKDQIFVSACSSVPEEYLASLSIRGEPLLPPDVSWRELDEEGLALFTLDAGDLILELSR